MILLQTGILVTPASTWHEMRLQKCQSSSCGTHVLGEPKTVGNGCEWIVLVFMNEAACRDTITPHGKGKWSEKPHHL